MRHVLPANSLRHITAALTPPCLAPYLSPSLPHHHHLSSSPNTTQQFNLRWLLRQPATLKGQLQPGQIDFITDEQRIHSFRKTVAQRARLGEIAVLLHGLLQVPAEEASVMAAAAAAAGVAMTTSAAAGAAAAPLAAAGPSTPPTGAATVPPPS